MKKFGERLRRLRLNKGLSLEELASAVDLTEVALYFCEKGRIAISIRKLVKLAKYFNVKLDYLLGLEN